MDDFNPSEWLNLFVRWFHVFAGILWIGQTWFFTWLDGALRASEAAASPAGASRAGVREDPPRVWLVHSGGFYTVEKPAVTGVPPRLHWSRWEAALTWLSGMALLVIVYYAGGILVDASVADISPGAGVAIGLGLLVLSWLVYDGMWRSPVGRSETVFAALSFLMLVAVAYGLTKVFSSRAAYMHVGAMLGTLMAANVWLRIIPAQRQMVAALESGGRLDPALGARAKLRTKHNTYMVLPVVLIMISNHFPVATYGSRYNWLVLGALVLVGWAAAWWIRARR
jgi:uncharacterized membrane protein